MTAPFIFFDQVGPAEFLTGQCIDVRPHPHVGLATVTYLYKGKIHHRDSLGTDQWIEPGAVNWMVAGHGITHSERADGDMIKARHSLFGIQTWVALPQKDEDAGASIPMPDNNEDRGLYVISGDVTVSGQTFEAGKMLVFRPGDQISAKAGEQGARIMLLGGATMDGPRHIWWNFVASSKDRIDAAKEAWRAGDWAHGRFQLPPGDDAEFIPAPHK